MQRIIGNEVTIFLKGSDNKVLGDMSGVLVDVSEESLYIQDATNSTKVFIVSRNNVDYCTTDKIVPQRQFVREGHVHPQQPQPQPQYQQEPEQSPNPHVIDSLNVYVNQQHVANIPIPPTFKIDEWNENILRVLLGNPEVQAAVAGKVQKGLEYFPGEVYIEVETITPPSQMPDQSPGYQTGFSMSGSPAQQYLSGMQMASRLNKVVKQQQRNDDGKTNV